MRFQIAELGRIDSCANHTQKSQRQIVEAASCRFLTRLEAASSLAMGSEDQRRSTAVKRLDIREILGTKTMREITLK
jgi:hypothetical protein